jgi:hypothetical protein
LSMVARYALRTLPQPMTPRRTGEEGRVMFVVRLNSFPFVRASFL